MQWYTHSRGPIFQPIFINFSVELFQNRAIYSSLAQTITDKVKAKFQTEANLKQVSYDGDLQFKGAITAYTITSDAPVSGATEGVNQINHYRAGRFCCEVARGTLTAPRTINARKSQ